ncbi:MAG: aminotransferase class I/II-fold pyridoxal phosphate-dependent enzyme [archaeon]
MKTVSELDQINASIKKANKNVYSLLSKRGQESYFPSGGILLQAADAQGKKINATIGIALNDDTTPASLKPIRDLINMEPKDYLPYVSSYGKSELRSIWAKKIRLKNPLLKNEISTPVVTASLSHAINLCGYLFIEKGDEVIMPHLFWENYTALLVRGYEGKIKTFNTFKNGGFDIKAMKKALAGKKSKKIIFLNFPNNPTGYTPTIKEADQILAAIKEAADKGSNIVAIVDDAYFGLVYKEDVYEESLFAKLSNLSEKVLAVKVDGPTKEDYAWGLRIGFMTFGTKNGNKELYAALENKTAGGVRGTVSNAANLSQTILVKAYSSIDYDEEKAKKYTMLKERFETTEKVLENKKFEKYFTPLPHNSGYFMCIELKKLDAESVRKKLLEKYSTGVVSQGKIVRIAFSAVKKDLIPELFENIYLACVELSK